MRTTAYVIAVALAVGLSGTASAQSTASGQTSTAPVLAGETRSHWTAAAFVGTSFGTQVNQSSSVDFGGELGYLWRGILGGEFLGDSAPSFKLTNQNLRFADDPGVHSYMANAIAALPLGAQGQFEPYISGGVGSIQLSANVFSITPTPGASTSNLTTTSASRSATGTNIGGGFLAFFGHFGFRGDVRHYRASTDNNLTSATDVDLIERTTLSGLDFWRGNAGVAIRW